MATKTTTTKITTTKTTPEAAPESSTKTTATASARLTHLDLRDLDVKAALTDTAYATVGAGDLAISTARELPQRLVALRNERIAQIKKAPTLVKEAPAKLQAELNDGIGTVRDEITSFATRGRKVAKSVSNSKSTKQALSQTETARSQVKGAVTSIRKALEQGQDAVGDAAQRIGVRRSA